MEIVQKEVDDILIIELKGELMGGPGAEEFKTLLFKAIENEKVEIVVDLANATWMNSSGLGMLVSGLSSIRSSGGDLRLVNVSERMRRPMEITRLDSVFQFYNSVEEAIQSYKQ